MTSKTEVAKIAAMLAEGMSVDDIAAVLDEQRIETLVAADEDEMMYGRDEDDGMTYAQREFHDRLSLGRNEAGEWRGFM